MFCRLWIEFSNVESHLVDFFRGVAEKSSGVFLIVDDHCAASARVNRVWRGSFVPCVLVIAGTNVLLLNDSGVSTFLLLCLIVLLSRRYYLFCHLSHNVIKITTTTTTTTTTGVGTSRHQSTYYQSVLSVDRRAYGGW